MTRKRTEHRHAFDLLDADRSGDLSRSELEGSALDLGSFESVDTNHDGLIDHWEFLPDTRLWAQWKHRRDQVWADFRQYDRDRNGSLSAAEVARTPMTLKQADVNRNGRVSFAELLYTMPDMN
jgi:Ca2+-binding EF-hand superfamily protein